MFFLSAIRELDTAHVSGGFISAVQGGKITSLCLAEDASFQLPRGTFLTSAWTLFTPVQFMAHQDPRSFLAEEIPNQLVIDY